MLTKWLKSNCDGDWEHSWGISIETLDNPGWSVKINLTGTALADAAFEAVNIENSDRDWMICKVQHSVFEGCGDPDN